MSARLWRADEIRALDARAIEEAGLPGAALMESAGAAAAALLRERWPQARTVAVVCGPGNNGGDGFVVARRLRETGLEAWLVLAAERERWRGDAATMLRVADALGVPEGGLEGADVVVDALLGTGARGAPEGDLLGAVERVNASGAPVLALDIPSGVDATSGETAGAAVRAAVTICFGGRKLGTAIEPGRGHAGEVVSADIGLPGSLASAPSALLLAPDDLALVPPRRPTGSKYDAGAVLVVGGSEGMAGAPALAIGAAFRAGAGLVRACVPESERVLVAGFHAEAMVAGTHDPDEVLAAAAGVDAVALGPGLGRDAGATALVDALVRRCERPLLIDADGLYPLSGRLEELRARPGPTALTPHAGELARLLGRTGAEVSARRLAAVETAAALAGCAVLLKGPDTLVAAPGEPLRAVECATPALATAGAGDVLSGVAAALLARGLAPPDALALASLAHGLAGTEAARAHRAITASDLAEPLGRLLG